MTSTAGDPTFTVNSSSCPQCGHFNISPTIVGELLYSEGLVGITKEQGDEIIRLLKELKFMLERL